MSTLVEFMIVAGKDHGRIILNSVENGPLVWPTVEQEDGTVRLKTYEELSDKEKLQVDCDPKATNIVLQGLQPDVYALVNHHKIAKDIWDKLKLLMQDTSLSRQERECKLYDEFDKFSHVKGETLYQYYWWFAQLINDMNIIQMTMQHVQVNTKFLNSLPPEWGKFVTDVKLARDLHTSNYDQLYAYLEQHDAHANEARLMRERFPDPLALVANYHQPSTHFNNYHSRYTTPQNNSLVILIFLSGDDPIACMNKVMAFLSDVFSPRYPPTNNQLRSSSNPRNQATVQDGRVTVQQVQGRQGQNVVGSGSQRNASDEEQLALLADPRVADGQVAQTITHNAAFQTDDLDAYDFDCDDISSAKAVLMANLSSCDSDVLSDVPYSDTFQNDMMNQSVKELQYSEQTPIVDYPDNEITSDSNIILYSQYLEETKQAIIKSILYDGNVISKTHDVLSVIDDEETLILDKESRLKMVEKQNDPIMKKEKINITPINYFELNKLTKDFGKRFVPQQELSTEQKFWLQSSDKNSEEPKFDKGLHDEITEVQTVFTQMEVVMEQCSVDMKCCKIQQKQYLIENDQLLDKIISQEIVNFVLNSSGIICDSEKKNQDSVDTCNKCLELEVELVKKNDVYIKLSKRFSNLEQLCFSLEVANQLNKFFFQKDKSSDDQNHPEIQEYFKQNDLKAQLQAKDTVISKLKETIHWLRENANPAKSMENAYFKAQIQEKVFANAALKNELRKLKGKIVIDTLVSKPHATTIAPGMEHADILWEIVKSARALSPLDSNLDSDCKYVQRIQEVLVYVRDTCPYLTRPGVIGSTGAGGSKLTGRTFTIVGVDLLTGSQGTNLYTLSIGDMMKSSLICLLSKASKTKSWLWHRRLSYLNFSTINQLAKQGLVRGLPKLKFEKYHLCSACSLGKSKKQSYKPKFEDTNQEKLYLLHMDLYGLMRVESIKGKKYILVIVDDYSQFTWVKFLRSKDEAPEFIIKFLKMIQVHLNAMAEAVATACYTQNRSLIRIRHGKTPYELLHDRKPYLSYLHVFGALCYPTNDSEDLGKQKAKVDVGIFIGYLTAMASKQRSSGPALNEMTPGTLSSGIVPQPPSSTPFVPQKKDDWDALLQPLFDEYFCPQPCVDHSVLKVVALVPAVLTGSPSSSSVDQDAPSPSTSQESPSYVIPPNAEEADHDIEVAHMDNNPQFSVLISELSSEESSSQVVIPNNVHSVNQPPEHISKWTKDHPINNVIGDPSRPVSTRHQLQTKALFCYFDVFLSSVEPKSYKEALTKSCWIESIPRGIFFNQSKYALEIIKKYGMETSDPVDTPMVEKSKLDADPQGKEVDPTYADHAGCQDTKRSTFRSMQILGDRLVSWSSKKQKSTAISSIDAEYITLYLCTAITKVSLLYVATTSNIPDPSVLTSDTTSSKSKWKMGVVELYFVRTEYQLADIFTKALG
ncbi:retrovirus-related pol polyprotein from transposon TNT 1-94 [Tanacetum coccineum]